MPDDLQAGHLAYLHPGTHIEVRGPGIPHCPAVVKEIIPSFRVVWIREFRTGERKMLCTDDHHLDQLSARAVSFGDGATATADQAPGLTVVCVIVPRCADTGRSGLPQVPGSSPPGQRISDPPPLDLQFHRSPSGHDGEDPRPHRGVGVCVSPTEAEYPQSSASAP